MAANPSDEPDLGTQLADAIEDYRRTWRTVDSDLYDLCHRRLPSHRSPADVYAKVVIIDRVYAAGLSRTFHAPVGAEKAVTDGLVGLADLIEQSLKDLKGRQFDRESAAQIVELHGRVTRGLLPYTDNTWQQSFVSKYLHFHCDIVPIYDANADHAIGADRDKGRFVYRRGQAVRTVRDSLPGAPPAALAYRSFVAAFVVLHERIGADPSIAASVKETDHLLWRSA
jgi:hypothetical protein